MLDQSKVIHYVSTLAHGRTVTLISVTHSSNFLLPRALGDMAQSDFLFFVTTTDHHVAAAATVRHFARNDQFR
jgi:hypothetical protein